MFGFAGREGKKGRKEGRSKKEVEKGGKEGEREREGRERKGERREMERRGISEEEKMGEGKTWETVEGGRERDAKR